jgi:hypothetical protein
VIVHLLSSGLIGIGYGLLFECESPDFAAGIAWGLLYGLGVVVCRKTNAFGVLYIRPGPH